MRMTLTTKKYMIYLLTFLLAAVLTACGKEENKTIPEKAFHIDCTETLEITAPIQVICDQETAWVITTVKNDYIYKITNKLGKVNVDKIEWKPENGDYYLVNIAGYNGKLYAEAMNETENRIDIFKYCTDSGWSEAVPISAENAKSYAIMGSGFYVDKNENMYLVNGDTVTCFNREGVPTATYKLKGRICLFQETEEGCIECVTAEKSGIICYKFIDGTAEQKWTCEVPAGQVHGIQVNNEEEIFCLATNQEILFLDKESGSLLEKTDLVKMGVSSLLSGYYDAEKGVLKVYSLKEDDKELQSLFLYEVDAQAQQKTELIYGMVGESNADSATSIWKAITTFNQENPDYYVTIRNYNNVDQLNADMAVGVGPDIIDMTYIDYYESYVKNGYLEDLSPYLDQSQYKDDIIWNVLDAYQVDGGLYVFIPQFQLEGILIHPEYVSMVDEWDKDMFLNLVEMNDWEMNIFSTDMGNYETLLYYMLLGSCEEFIDWNQKEAAFESQEFMNVLALCKECKETDWPDTSDWISEEYYRNTLCMPVAYGGGFGSYLSYVNIYGREYQIFGFPTNSGQVYGINACYDSCAIYSGSKQKEGAWKFIESLLWDSNQHYLGRINPGFPIRNSVFEEMKQEEVTLRADGETVTMSENEKEILEDIIYNEEVSRMLVDPKIWNVIREETPYYFEGERSVEETACIIQSRVQIILQE